MRAAALLAILFCAVHISAAPGLARISPADAMPNARDYTHMWWANGWDHSKRTLASPKILCFETGWYAMAINIETLELTSFGSKRNAIGYDRAPAAPPEVSKFPAAVFSIEIRHEGDRYRAGRAAQDVSDWLNYPARIIDSGRFFQRADVLQVEFENDTGKKLPTRGRLEIAAWPERLTFWLDVTNSPPVQWTLTAGKKIWQSNSARLEINFEKGNSVDQTIELPESRVKPGDLDHMDWLPVAFTNDTSHAKLVRVLFNKHGSVHGITGLTPMLRDLQGNPTGVPIQISKNWHATKDRPVLYQGGWLHAYTTLRIPPRSIVEGEFTIAYGRWGGVPAVSHAQLCLIGWGCNQLWDEVAIGSWGESFCYEPDRAQRCCMIDDIRPLLVTPMSGKPKQYDWTANVGGGDFLVYYNNSNLFQRSVEVRTTYHAVGPNLTSVTYSGNSADGHIGFKVSVSSPRSDDIARAYHRFRYDVLKPTPFQRLAFYQLGADHYSTRAKTVAYGDVTGLVKEQSFETKRGEYDATNFPARGRLPWVSLHDTAKTDAHPGPMANRGLIVREWRARIAGKKADPHFSFFGTENGPGLELSAPAGCRELSAGDYVEALVEVVVLPMEAHDYYGPNEPLRKSLQEHQNPWQSVHRQAIGNDLKVEVRSGRLRQNYPPVIESTRGQAVDFSIQGGLAYVPVTITGLKSHDANSLWQMQGGKWERVIQEVHGSDFWQTTFSPETRWARTYNLLLDASGRESRKFKLKQER